MSPLLLVPAVLLLVTLGSAGAQGPESAPAPVPTPVPVLDPAQALASFTLEPGFSLELVAAEPLVLHPVALDIDAEGRYWVVEMPGYMRDVKGTGELSPTGSIAVLEDTDHDGAADRRTVFLDGLVLPRAVKALAGGALVGEPPYLWFCPDADGDLVADRKVEVRQDYALRQDHPNYGPNGLVWTLDNWITSAVYPLRLRRSGPDWTYAPDLDRGQWGLSFDDQGRLFANSNREPLLVDLVPAAGYTRNPHSRGRAGWAEAIARDQTTVWPVRPTPGVSLADQPGTLRPDGTLVRFTSACGPVVYRGDAFPEAYRGQAFVCEPAANLVKRLVIEEEGAWLTARTATPGREFLASTDERFRPVNLANGPDGCLYLVDMYKGIIEYKQQISPRLEGHIESHGLDAPDPGQGRLYRIRHRAPPRRDPPGLPSRSTPELIGLLAHRAGWLRDMAQQVLIQRQDPAAGPGLEAMARDEPVPGGLPPPVAPDLGRIHALWTLEGLDRLTTGLLIDLFADPDPRIRAQALRAGTGPIAAAPDARLLAALTGLARDPDESVRVQAAFALAASPSVRARRELVALLAREDTSRFVTDAAVSGLVSLELEAVLGLLEPFASAGASPGRERTLRVLASCVLEERDPRRLLQLLGRVADPAGPRWQRQALMAGIHDPLPWVTLKPIAVAGEPAALAALARDPADPLASRAAAVLAALTWPGRGPASLAVVDRPLTGSARARFERGSRLFPIACAPCHDLDGRGRPGTAPPLAGSPWIQGHDRVLIRIVLQGIEGPVEVAGQRFESQMPSLGALSDPDLADLLTYVRRAWGHRADPVDASDVTSVREATRERAAPWTVPELELLQR